MSLSRAASHVLQRVVLPTDDPARVLPLYVEGPARPELVVDRRSYQLPVGERVSFATYFNAFPAAHWRHSTGVDEVCLQVELRGPATVEVYRSDHTGAAQRVARAGGEALLEVPLSLDGFAQGGWLWFEVTADAPDVRLVGAHWTGPEAPSVTASVGITTYNRVDSCLHLLRQLGEDPELLAMLDAVYVVDQGDDRISSTAGTADVTAALGGRLQVIEQPNLGGSGGFARCQLETLQAARSDHLVILDDDVVLETESIRRAVTFAAHCSRPTLVGAHMFSLAEPTRLHALAECVDMRRFRWGPKHFERREHDLAAAGLRETPWLHVREDVNYNGWWMCLIPRAVLEKSGLSLPFFIRWDDAEYGVRTGADGQETVSLPGVGVWHVPWTHKTDALDWQAYFHQRNRVVTALLHSPYDRGGLVLPELFLQQLKYLAAMQYSTAELRLQAMADVLDGPRGLHAALRTAPERARRMRDGFADADVRPRVEDFPAAPPVRTERGRRPVWLNAARGLLRLAAPTSGAARPPQVRMDAEQAQWTQLLRYDSAVVSAADGSGAVWYRRDRATATDIARRSMALHRRLLREWPRLSAEYRGALAEIASPAAWQDTFESVRSDG